MYRVFGVADGLHAFTMQSLHFQRCEQRLCYRVVPAATLAAHRSLKAVLFLRLAEVLASVLASAIGVEE